MTDAEFLSTIKQIVANYLTEYHQRTVSEKEIYVVWRRETSQVMKLLLNASTPDYLLFEISLNAVKNESYLTVYDVGKHKQRIRLN